MWIFGLTLNLNRFGISNHNPIRNIHNEVYSRTLLISTFPVMIELLIFWSELLEFMANEKTCNMIVIIRTAKCFKIMQIALD